MAVTIAEIAKRVDMSQMTVSRALRGVGQVSPDTRRRVQQVAREMGYQRQVNGANTGTALQLGVVLPYFGEAAAMLHEAEPFRNPTREGKSLHERFVAALGQRLKISGGYLDQVVVADIDEFESAWPRWGAQAVVLRQSLPHAWVKRIGAMAATVAATLSSCHLGVDSVAFNEEYAVTLIQDYLWQRGHRRVVWFDVLHHHAPVTLNESAFDLHSVADQQAVGCTSSLRLSAWSRLAVMPDEASEHELLLLRRDYRRMDLPRVAAEGLEKICSRTPRPTAVVTAHDGIALELLAAATKQGIRIPDDLSLISYCGYEAARNSDPPVTTMELPMEQVAESAVELIERRIVKPDALTLSLRFDAIMFEGKSVADLSRSGENGPVRKSVSLTQPEDLL